MKRTSGCCCSNWSRWGKFTGWPTTIISCRNRSSGLPRLPAKSLRNTGAITAALFRDRIGTGRKLAIQILEFFDASAITRRAGDAHHLR